MCWAWLGGDTNNAVQLIYEYFLDLNKHQLNVMFLVVVGEATYSKYIPTVSNEYY